MGFILIVDDNEDLRELYATVLRERGYEVEEAADGRVAHELLSRPRRQPCLVLLDLMMPVMSGVELLRVLSTEGRLETLPVVALSAGGAPEHATGARRFMSKPDSAAALIPVVEEFCGKACASRSASR